jgi:D-alanyl-D-alanine carboxypeptidase
MDTLLGSTHLRPAKPGDGRSAESGTEKLNVRSSRVVRLFAVLTRVLAVVLLPIAFLYAPGRARHFACQWALAARFPAENLRGLTQPTLAAFTAARTEALWLHGQLIGLTSGYRDAAEQHRLFTDEVRRVGSTQDARMRVLPPQESTHVSGIAMDVRPVEGARWLEDNGSRFRLYRTYDNEWWHFEYRPECGDQAPRRLLHPGAQVPTSGSAVR